MLKFVLLTLVERFVLKFYKHMQGRYMVCHYMEFTSLQREPCLTYCLLFVENAGDSDFLMFQQWSKISI